MFFKIDVRKNFASFLGKHLCWSLFLKNFILERDFIKKRLQHRCFPMKFVKLIRTPFFTKHLWWLLLFNFINFLYSAVNDAKYLKTSKCRGVLEPSPTFMMEFFVKTVNGFWPLAIFPKKLHHRCWAGF